MADYIRRNILCQAYVHVLVEQDYHQAVERIKSDALPLVKSRVEYFLYEDASVEFDPSEGSVKSRITIFGTLILALQGISNYKDFRESVILLHEDVERVAQVAVTETLFALHERHAKVERIEVRTGVVGSLRRMIRQIDAIKAETGGTPHQLQLSRLEDLQDEILKLIENLHDEGDVGLVEDQLGKLLGALPKNPKPSPRRELTQTMIDSYRSRRKAVVEAVPRAARARTAKIRAARIKVGQ